MIYNLPSIEVGQRGVPNWGTELTYIESTGTQYIDSGVKPSETTRHILNFMVFNDTNTTYIYGCQYDSSTQRYYVASSGQLIGFNIGSNYVASTTGSLTANVKHTADYTYNNGSQTLVFDGTSYTNTTTLSAPSYNIFLMANNYRGNPDTLTGMRWYGSSMYNGSTPVRNYIPMVANEAHTAYRGSTQVTCSAGEAGLWDTVEEKFYINSGTGSFVEGIRKRDLPTGYTQVEYVEATGTQYINSGITVILNRFRFEADIEANSGGQFGLRYYPYGLVALTSNGTDNANLAYWRSWGQFADEATTGLAPNVRGQISYIGTTLTKADGTTVTISNNAKNVSYQIAIFSQGVDGDNIGTGKIYRLVLYDLTTELADLTPCLNSNNVVGFYNHTDNSFLHSSSGTELIAGEPV